MTRQRINTAEAAKHLGLPEATLRYYRSLGKGPRSFKLGNRVFYFVDELDDWVETQYQATVKGGDAA